MDARPEPTIDADLIDQLRVLKARGLTFGQVVHVYAEDNTPRQRKLIEKARDLYEHEGKLEFGDNVVASGSSDRGDYVMAWRWVDDDERTVTWRAAVTPEAWVAGKIVEVDAPGEREWDASAFVPANWEDYFEELAMDDDREDFDGSFIDDKNLLKGDPAAPAWVRDWQGPLTIRVRREED